MKDTNYQYAYTTEEAIALSLTKKEIPKNSILVKNGQTIEQTVSDRLKQQDNASSTSKPVLICSQKIEHNTDIKLDDKIRDYICYKGSSLDFQDYIREDNKHNEWTIVNVKNILKKLKIKLSVDIIKDEDFMKMLSNKITKAKTEAIKDILNKNLLNNIELREWQKYMFNKISKQDKKYNLLSLSPRFGKTFLVLELVKDYVRKTGSSILLVPVSKYKSSNTSFENDYKTGSYGEGEYSFKLAKSSLFVDENKVIERIREISDDNTEVICVTDEADFGSHTKSSITKINAIRDNFNVVKYYAMTGTGVYKAAKIFHNIPEENICFETMNYSEMMEFNKPIVKRNFLNVQLNINDYGDSKNIRQSIKDPIDHEDMSKYLNNFIAANPYTKRANLKELKSNDAIMVFIDANNKSQLSRFIKYFESKYSDVYNCLTITGDETSNSHAEKYTKKRIREMKQKNDNRLLVIFSNGMACRSYSISEIKRVIVMKDGALSNADYQKFSRALTLKEGKTDSDIIRISFSNMDLDSEIFMIENESISHSPETKEVITKFIMNNSFSKMEINDNGDVQFHELHHNTDSDSYILDFIDKTMKFTDTTKYLITRLFGEGVEVDITSDKRLSSNIKSVDDTAKLENQDTQYTQGTQEKLEEDSRQIKEDKENQLALERYIDVMRLMPYMCICFNIGDIKELFNIPEREWYELFEIDKKLFVKNYNSIQEFKNILESLFRNAQTLGIDYAQEKLDEYLSL